MKGAFQPFGNLKTLANYKDGQQRRNAALGLDGSRLVCDLFYVLFFFPVITCMIMESCSMTDNNNNDDDDDNNSHRKMLRESADLADDE